MTQYRKLILPALLLASLAGAAVWLFQYLQRPSVELVLRRTAASINARCPTALDPDTRLDSVAVLSHPIRTFQFNCTLLSSVPDSVALLRTRSYFQPRLRDRVAADPSMAYLRRHRVVVAFRYNDIDGRHLFEYPIGPKEYLLPER